MENFGQPKEENKRTNDLKLEWDVKRSSRKMEWERNRGRRKGEAEGKIYGQIERREKEKARFKGGMRREKE